VLGGVIVLLAIASYPAALRRIGRRWAAASAFMRAACARTAFTRFGADPIPIVGRHLMAILATCTYFDAVTVLCEHREPDWRSYLPLPLGANRIVSA